MHQILRHVSTRVARLATLIDAPLGLLPAYEVDETGRPYVEREGSAFGYVVNERGEELMRRRTESLDELLYWIFADVTHAMAADWESLNRTAPPDSRRRLMSMQLSLLLRVDAAWASRYRLENAALLREVGLD
jgi:hypothetical protein